MHRAGGSTVDSRRQRPHTPNLYIYRERERERERESESERETERERERQRERETERESADRTPARHASMRLPEELATARCTCVRESE